MNAFLLLLFLTCGIMLAVSGLPYGNLFSKYESSDEYYEGLRKTPRFETAPYKVKAFLVDSLSWFPVDDLKQESDSRNRGYKRQNYFVDFQVEDSTTRIPQTTKSCKFCANVEKVKQKFGKFKNFTEAHRPKPNWTNIRMKSSKSMHVVKNYMRKKNLKEVLRNITHPLRYRGPSRFIQCCTKSLNEPDCIRYLGPSIRVHPKSSHVEVIQATTTTTSSDLDSHFSIPRKIKVIIDLTSPDKTSKMERNVNDNYLAAALEGFNGNSTNLRESPSEMTSDLAGRVTSLWHCMLGSHRVPDNKDVKFYLYTRRNVILPELLKVNYELINRKIRETPKHVDVECVDLPPENIPEFERVSDENREIIKSNFLNIRAPTKILIHGYTGSYKDSRMAKIKDAYLRNGRYNVIQVDWEILAAPPCYIRVTHHSKFVGEIIARFLDGLHLVGQNMSLVHLVGFSLGAQVAGFAGNNATLAPVCRITGLDPALPLFLHTQPSGHLDRLDAKFVDVIHTCGGILAMLDPLGHVDFYPNGGTRQPGCEFSNLKCSHSRAPQYFAESVVSKKKFTGQLCINWEEYVAGNCNNTTDISFMGEPCSRRSVFGKYYLLTKSKEPFVL